MARAKRIDYPGARHHVMNRSLDNLRLFQDDQACGIFVDILSEMPQRFGVVIQGFALVGGHFHLMIQTPRGNLSAAMSFLLSTFTRRYNSLRSAEGPLFEGRFLSRLVTDDSSWGQLLVQLHTEPVRAGLSPRAEDFSWSSHRYFTDGNLAPHWLKVAPVLSGFPSLDAYYEALRDVSQSAPDYDELFQAASTGPLIDYSAGVHAQISSPTSSEEDIVDLLGHIVRVTGAELNELRSARRGRRGNAPRVVAAYWLMYRGGLTNGETAERLCMSPASVSQSLARVRGREPGGEIDSYLQQLMSDGYGLAINV